ncbi:MAG: aldo/keto reductase [Candidatus Bipolaricaulia bacterium]
MIVHANGAEIPALGFGTFEIHGSQAEEMVHHALELGYRHIDTAQAYENEAEVGRAIERSPVDRSELFLTTKIMPQDFGRRDLPVALEKSLDQLGTDYVDLVLLHWPNPEVPIADTMEALQEVREAGHTRHIGVSNFTVALLNEALAHSDVPLVTNQVEYHPFLSQAPVLDVVRANGMSLTAYSPLAKGDVAKNEVLQRIGEAHGKTPGQVALRWLIQQDQVIAIPKTANPERCEANFQIFDFQLSDEEMAQVHDLARPDGRYVDPPGVAPEWDT